MGLNEYYITIKDNNLLGQPPPLPALITDEWTDAASVGAVKRYLETDTVEWKGLFSVALTTVLGNVKLENRLL